MKISAQTFFIVIFPSYMCLYKMDFPYSLSLGYHNSNTHDYVGKEGCGYVVRPDDCVADTSTGRYSSYVRL